MKQEWRKAQAWQADTLMATARAGGPDAALAARRAAALTELREPALAREALAIAVRLEPLDPVAKLALARLHAEAGDLDAASNEAAGVLVDSFDQGARARAAFILGEIQRVQGDRDAARRHYEIALRIEDDLLATNRNDATAARWYARARGRLAELDATAGDRNRAQSGAEGALAMLRAAAAQIGETPALAADIADAELRLGALELDNDQPGSARRRFGEAIERYEALAVTETSEPHWRAVLADAWALAAEADYVRGAADHARAAMEKATQARIGLAANFPDEEWALAGVWRVRGALRAALGDHDVAAESYAQAAALAAKLAQKAGTAEAPSRFLVHALLDQADHALRTGALPIARDAADLARRRAEAFAASQGAHATWLGDAAACWDRLGEVARAAKAHAPMQDAFARAVEFRRLALERGGKEPRFARGLAAALLKQGEAALEAGEQTLARTAFGESVGLRLLLAEATPTDVRAAHALAAALERAGLAARAMGDTEAARHAWEDELALANRIFPRDSLEGLRFRAIVESHLVSVGGLRAEDHRASALDRFDALAKAGVLTEQEASLRRSLWRA
ncbi:MAG: hypothetical protein AB7O98_00940 [Hyphomonadaceae bacterium]